MHAHMPPYSQDPEIAAQQRSQRVQSQQPTGAYRSNEPVDPVTKPAHYQRAGIETIDYIRATLGDGFEAYCIGNVLKYVSRYREKGGIEDLRKAQVYLGWAIEPVKAEPKNPERDTDLAKGVGNAGTDQIERVPKWDPRWGASDVTYKPFDREAFLAALRSEPPHDCGLSARDVRAPHPMASEVIRDHDERLAGGEDRL